VTHSFEFWFDFSCPYAYLASTQVEQLAERTGSKLVARPLLLGGVFRAVSQPQNLAASLPPPKAAHNVNDLQRHAELFGVPLRFPSNHPIRTVLALRCLLAVGEPFLPLAHRFFRAYWVDGVDLSSPEGVAGVLRGAGLAPEPILEAAALQTTKDDLRVRTQQAIDKGVFGVPAFFVGDQLYWGQDRLGEVEQALGGERVELPNATPGVMTGPVDFWFDYSSPFAYLASTRVERKFGPGLRFRPMLLGAVFREVGTVNVPLLEMSESKRSFQTVDMARQAEHYGVELKWPDHFPLRTVLPLRVTLLALQQYPDQAPALIHRIYRACWVDGLDPAQEETVVGLCADVGLPADLVEQASLPETKDLLRESTAAAIAAGVFGAPTYVVQPEASEPQLFWGSDRLHLAARAARVADLESL